MVRQGWFWAVATVLAFAVVVVALHVVHVLPLPPTDKVPPTTDPPIYTPTDRGWLGKW